MPPGSPQDDNHLTLAILIASETAVDAMLFQVGWLHIAAEVAAIPLTLFAFTADNATAHFFCHRFAYLVQQHECGLVGQAQVTAQGERALALHFVAEFFLACLAVMELEGVVLEEI